MAERKQDIATAAMTRRAFLGKGVLMGAALTVLAAPDLAEAALRAEKRTLSFYHTHTGRKLQATYAVGTCYNPFALAQINRYLGDFRTGEVHVIDPRLLDMLWVLQRRCGKAGVFSVISGYRSPQTNARLRGKGSDSGVAKKSLHMEGRAIDVRFSELSTRRLRDYALDLRTGGVGYYPASDFVHLDTGQHRSW